MIPTRLPALFAVLLCACQPNGKTVMALVYDTSGTLKVRQTELTTVTSTVNLKGSVVDLVGGGHIVLNDPNSILADNATDQQIATNLLRDPGGDVRANLIDKAGVLWPADFHSWNMVSTYWNFEQAFLYYNDIYDGAPTDKLAGAKVYYWGNYENLAAAADQQQLHDNAIYFSPVKGFVLAPFYSCPGGTKDDTCGCPDVAACFEHIPLAMNLGIIGHEMNHRVFSQKAYADAAIPAYLGWSNPGFNILKGLDEGLSDFHGYGVTCVAKDGPGCQPNFLAASIGDDAARPRDFTDASRCMTVELRTAIANLAPAQWTGTGRLYNLGTLFSTALYQAAFKGGKLKVMQKSLIASYDDESSTRPGFKQVLSGNLANSANFTLELVTNTIIAHITDPDLARVTCNELRDRLDLSCTADATHACVEIPDCPRTSTRGTTCPVLPPP